MKLKKVIIFIMFSVGLSSFIFAADIEITNAGVTEANGVYKESGVFNGHPKYVKGNCEIRYKGKRAKWMLYIDDKQYYRNFEDSEKCPTSGWKITRRAKDISTELPSVKIKSEVN
jgi:hypothetical protein